MWIIFLSLICHAIFTLVKRKICHPFLKSILHYFMVTIAISSSLIIQKENDGISGNTWNHLCHAKMLLSKFLGEDLQVCFKKNIRSMFSLYRVYFLKAGISTGQLQHSTLLPIFMPALVKGSIWRFSVNLMVSEKCVKSFGTFKN